PTGRSQAVLVRGFCLLARYKVDLTMARNTFVVGVGMTRFGKFPEERIQSLGREAALMALRDAGISPNAVEVISCGSARSGNLQGRESGVGQLIGWELGIEGV